MIFTLPTFLTQAVATAGYGAWLMISTPSHPSFLLSDQSVSTNVPILEVIKVYGKVAGPTCFGKTAPKGSSCQATREDFDRFTGGSSSNSKEQLAAQLNKMDFQWPLKPYGVEKSEYKTAIVNKGAETRLYTEELEQRGLYDRRNPTGPLPTSLRPNLNRILQQEGVSQDAVDLVFDRLAGTNGILNADFLFQGRPTIDYYDFLEFLGKKSITW
eukprot:CAMPEP_0116571178 /NCGR_PEP_ID=MMETSP0397-20121206/17405_1 /TAXON_ID=216820 /ORGANISM="Cyclophora tenuis, Strain ECT3854" /LENGTH=213 /DNA_ID=CAMNT_0004099225 /DNA_START=1100 /DNA_END=1738 /DNA_ORIENTATION=-